MGRQMEIILEKGETETLTGIQYSVEYDIEGDGYKAKLSLDHTNKRVKVLQYSGHSIKGLVLNVRELAEANRFDKIIFMAKEDDWETFLTHGYILEAIIRYYHNGDKAYVMSKFRSLERATSSAIMEETMLIEQLMEVPPQINYQEVPEGHEIRLANRDDIPELAKLYDEVFETYPTPLEEVEYIEKIFEVSSLFMIVKYDNQIVASASGEFFSDLGSAELTDCATLKDHRGKGLMTLIIRQLENELIGRGYQCGFSMARAKSFGMNQVFYNLGYQFMGRLLNQCDIYGDYEDMNIWVKKLKS